MTYALVVALETYDFDGQFYLIGEGCDTPGEVLVDVAAEHIHAIERSRSHQQYLLDVLQSGDTVSRSEYDAADADVECWLYADVYYGRYWFETEDREFELPIQPTQTALEEVAVELDS